MCMSTYWEDWGSTVPLGLDFTDKSRALLSMEPCLYLMHPSDGFKVA